MKLLFHCILLLLSFGFIFTWQQTLLVDYTFHALGILFTIYILLYILLSIKNRKLTYPVIKNESLSIILINTIVILLVFATGTFSSFMFFILYFLIFGIAFVFEPFCVFMFALGCFLIFLPEALQNDTIGNIIRLCSILLLSPLAYYFGRELHEKEKNEANKKK